LPNSVFVNQNYLTNGVPIAVQPFFSEELRFPHAFVHKPGDVRYGLVWFGQLPGKTAETEQPKNIDAPI